MEYGGSNKSQILYVDPYCRLKIRIFLSFVRRLKKAQHSTGSRIKSDSVWRQDLLSGDPDYRLSHMLTQLDQYFPAVVMFGLEFHN
jgi:hypothetical protein